jgi:hypothetical protein
MKTRLLLAVLGTLGISHALSDAAVISINVGANGTVSGPAGAVVAGNWTNLFGSDQSSSNLIDDSALATTLDAAFIGGANTFNNFGGNDKNMLTGFLSGGTVNVTLTQVPYATYDVYVYFNGFGDNNNNTWQASDVTDPGNPSLVDQMTSFRGTQDTFTFHAANGHVESALNTPGTYVKFTGMNVASLRIARTAGSGEIGISGIQVVDTSAAIPEPTTALALGLGAGLFALRRRRIA